MSDIIAADKNEEGFLRLFLYDEPFEQLFTTFDGSEEEFYLTIDKFELSYVVTLALATYNNITKKWSLTSYPLAGVGAYDVRFRFSGIGRDLNFRVPTLSCVLSNVPEQVMSVLRKDSSKVFINFSVFLGGVSQQYKGETQRVSYKSADLGYWSITKLDVNANTFFALDKSVSTPMVQIDAVPAIYLFNSRLKWGARSQFLFSHEVTNPPQYNYADISFLLQFDYYIARKLKNNPFPDPIYYFSKTNTGRFWGNSSERQVAEEFIKSTKAPFISTTQTFFTLFSKILMNYGYAFTPGSSLQSSNVGVRFVELPFYLYRNDDAIPEDLPCKSFDVSIFDSDIIFELNYDFGLVDNGSSLVCSFSSCVYDYSYYVIVDVKGGNSTTHTTSTVSWSKSLSGLISSKPNISQQFQLDDIYIYNLTGLTKQGGEFSSGFFIPYAQMDKNSVEYYFPDSSLIRIGTTDEVYNPNGGNYGYTLGFFAYSVDKQTDRYSVVDTPDFVYSSDSQMLSIGDSQLIYVYGDRPPLRCKLLESYAKYISGTATFTTLWRPWINIYDVVRFKCLDADGTYKQHYGFVVDIDIQADTLTAKYTVLISFLV